MLRALNGYLARRRLRDPAYRYLLEPPNDTRMIAFDCETTGLDPGTAELLTIGAVPIEGNRILTSERLELVIRPQATIASEAIKVHHLRQIDVADGLAPREAIARFIDYVGSRPLVGYYLEFDVAMINKYLRPWLGIGLQNRQFDISSLYYDYAQRCHRGHPYIGNVDLGFDTIIERLAIPRLNAHNAYNDALMTAMAYLHLRQ